MLVGDLEKIEQSKIYSMHDFDLSITLKLLKKINAIDSVRIIAIPPDYVEEKAVEETAEIISSLLSGSV